VHKGFADLRLNSAGGLSFCVLLRIRHGRAAGVLRFDRGLIATRPSRKYDNVWMENTPYAADEALHLSRPESNRFLGPNGSPLTMQSVYVKWLVNLRNNQMATVNSGANGEVTNFLFDAITEFDKVASDLVKGLSRSTADIPLWLQLIVRSQQIGLTALHLALGGLLQEGGCLMRLAIETFAHGLELESKPFAAELWMNKTEETLKKAYKECFHKATSKRLFKSIPGLHEQFSFWCEFGAHSTKYALAVHAGIGEIDAQVGSEAKINRVLLHLLSSYSAMTDLARTRIKNPRKTTRPEFGRWRRLGTYQARMKELVWDICDNPLLKL